MTIAPGPCNDGMSDRTYRDTVTVVADGKTGQRLRRRDDRADRRRRTPVSEPIVNTN